MKIRIMLVFATLFFLQCGKNNSNLSINHDSKWTNSILLVIDMQKGLLDTNSSQHVESGMVDNLIRNVNDNITKARKMGMPIVYIRNEWSNPLINLFTKNVCKQGTKQVALDGRIRVESNLVFVKSVPSTFSNKSFCKYVIDNKVGTIYIEGIMAQACVFATGKAGMKNNMRIVMLEDGIGSTSSKTKSKMLKKYLGNNMILQKQL